MPRETSVFVWGQHRTSLDESNVLEATAKGSEGTMTHLLPVRIESFQEKRVVSLSCGETHTLAATEDGLVWSWGFGWSGQLGNGNRDAKSKPTVVNQLLLLKALSNNLPAQAEAGGDHSLALTAAGDVYAWGANLYGQLGFGYNSSAGPGGAGMGGAAGIAGESGGSGVTDSRRGSSRMLRDDDLPQELVAIPRLVVSFHERKVVQVATGGAHSLALTADGGVYAWGRGTHGRLGTGAEAHCFEPTRVRGIKDVTAVQCGWSHSLALREGKVYAWGRGSDGRLGTGSEAHALVPTPVTGGIDGQFVIRISGGFAHSAALTVTRQVFTWGWGQFGQLGLGDTSSQLVATQVKALEKAQVRSIECGSIHTAAVTDQGELFTWGMGGDGQLGHGDSETRTFPERVSFFEDTHVESVFCGSTHTYAVTAGEVIIPADPELEEDSLQSAELRQQFLQELSTLHAQLEDTILHSDNEAAPEAVDVDELFPYNFPAVEQLVLSPVDGSFLAEVIESKAEKAGGDAVASSSPTEDSNSSGDFATVERVTVFEDYPNLSSSGEVLELCSPCTPSRWQEDLDLEPFEPVVAAGSLNAESPATPAQAIPKGRKRRKSRPQAKEKGANEGSPRTRSKSMSQKFSDVISGRYFRNQRAQQNEEVNQKVASIWLNKIVPRFDEIVRNPQTNWQLWRQGIPASVRGIVWKRAMPNTLNLTQEDFARFSAMEGSRHIDVIDVDLPRTFPNLGLFHKGGALYPALHTVLRCYDNLNPTMGYVQGMSYLGAMLVLHMEPFDAFVVFANMLNSPFFAAMYRMDMERMFKHMKLYETLFEILMPGMYKQFQSLGISTEHYLIDWFFTLFTKSLPLDICSRIWDSFFIEGQIFLFVTALSIVNVNRAKLVNADFETVITLLRLLPRDTNEDELFKAINKVSVPNYLRKFLQHIVDEESTPKAEA